MKLRPLAVAILLALTLSFFVACATVTGTYTFSVTIGDVTTTTTYEFASLSDEVTITTTVTGDEPLVRTYPYKVATENGVTTITFTIGETEDIHSFEQGDGYIKIGGLVYEET